ncbi:MULTISPECIES: hypothetical protein [Burkholderia]|uniref:T6SS effector phospholipase Tle3 domain-containing protein n=1 Tax=Burkholderia TaxID=32008 RepID=UPI000B2A31E7|nr:MULTISPECIES: hypothetical protein [Burkholderia]MCA7888455.1 hypothetical protein [Burkholderia contaminans]
MADTADTAPASPGASENNPPAQDAASGGGGLDPRTPAGGGTSGGGDDSQNRYLVANGNGVVTLNQSDYLCVMQMPLPGIVIFVHGVNSEGEWFEPGEEGLCAGLNKRLGREEDQLTHRGPQGGQMGPMHYTASLTDDGFINPKLTSKTYLQPDENTYSPVIHFRWGYKANAEELKRYGESIFLNEKNYWGGGPFANGCGSLPDLWNAGVDPRIFGFINVQGINPTQRPIFETPPRMYNVMGALRLAKLIGSIRKVQKDVPITVVCHSQGNMVGIASAFLGDRLSAKAGVRCVADTYVLANPPYGVVGSIEGDNSPFMEHWTERNDKDSHGNRGRVESQARVNTLKAFFELIAQSKDSEDQRDPLDYRMTMANMKPREDGKPAYDPDNDRKQYGVQNYTYGRVTLYSCPHDQVISAAPVQGMGWRGLHPKEVELVKGSSLFTQRVFATNFQVGQEAPVVYRTWEDDWRYGRGSSKLFFYPTSPPAKYDLVKALRGNPKWYGKVGTIAFAPALYIVTMATSAFGMFRTNADPPKGWHVLCDAPGLPEPFFPQAIRFGAVVQVRDGDAESDFNEDNDPVAAQRNKNKTTINTADPYDTYNAKGKHAAEMAPHGDASTEASQRYEDRAIARMEARHKDNPEWVKGGEVVGEAGPDAQMPDGYQKWRNKQIVQILDAKVNNPTNHSTIMTNPMHAEKALAYDVAIGICRISQQQLNDFRKEADWRFGKQLEKDNPNRIYSDYFEKGKMNGDFLQDWVLKDAEATLPESIDDKRQGGAFLCIGGGV